MYPDATLPASCGAPHLDYAYVFLRRIAIPKEAKRQFVRLLMYFEVRKKEAIVAARKLASP